MILGGLTLALVVLPLDTLLRQKLPDALHALAPPLAVFVPALVVMGAVGPITGFAVTAQQEDASLRQAFRSGGTALKEQLSGLPLPVNTEGVLADAGAALGSFLASLMQSLASGLVGAGLALFLAAIVLWERDLWAKVARRRSPEDDPERTARTLVRVGHMVRQYLWVKTAVGLLSGAVAGVACWLLGIEGALLWGVLVWFFSYVPNLGAFIAASFPMTVALATVGLGPALGLGLILALNEQITGNLIAPKMLGDAVDVPASAALAAVLLGAGVWGAPGVLLGVPVLLAAKGFLEAGTAREQVG